MAGVDELTKKLGALNTELAYYKCVDDIEDGDKGGIKKLAFNRGHKRAQKAYPELCAIVRKGIEEQAVIEKAATDSIDRAADPSATMMARLSEYFWGTKKARTHTVCFTALGNGCISSTRWTITTRTLRRTPTTPLGFATEQRASALL